MERIRSKAGPWLNIFLFALTVASTFFVGLSWSLSFKYGSAVEQGFPFNFRSGLFGDRGIVTLSVLYAAVLLVILLGHEFGHYLACRRYRIEATLPYFVPAPTLIGTLGAFIKIQSPITRKRQLFDIGAAGPLTGFLLSVPALVIGLSLSKIAPPFSGGEALVFGEPLLFKFVAGLLFTNVPPGYVIIPHPVAFAGWVGILVTSLNLFPMGQLDGGHIFFAMLGRKASAVAKAFLVAFVVMGVFFWVGWFVWALIILLLGLKHPRVADEDVPLSPGRKAVGVFMVLVFIVSFVPAPILGFNLFDLLRQLGL